MDENELTSRLILVHKGRGAGQGNQALVLDGIGAGADGCFRHRTFAGDELNQTPSRKRCLDNMICNFFYTIP